ncbi:nucleoside 5-triphosphatase RdgB [Bacillus sp. JCM 19045]|uniref:dITP/XTP pyrophosphatase n=1 Tax=Shouchella xiaoxiensis TaxID=766895 RepID=A0ABS2SSP0_9BACI|nr:XTP/dITP diphosphatase [Shouchella xiaoxiensis]MBM7838540.1 XTP/dITP diphosphohydrolase [Shouchella xiaoxiensis]GAF13404.1 nucleoside 5-triphosphatase RdgB [Bacillus sp. JCM 19045]
MRKELVIATSNKGKIKEFKTLFAGMYEVKSLLDYPEVPEIIEDGDTFKANAAKKAETLAAYLNQNVLADDSGLSIDALNGEPGVFSARYAGTHKSDADNMAKVLSKLAEVPEENRIARFTCMMAIAEPGKETLFFEGQVEGIIATEARGTNGFGYDPIFLVPAYGQTMAELTSELKNKISHRADAIRQVKNYLLGG